LPGRNPGEDAEGVSVNESSERRKGRTASKKKKNSEYRMGGGTQNRSKAENKNKDEK